MQSQEEEPVADETPNHKNGPSIGEHDPFDPMDSVDLHPPAKELESSQFHSNTMNHQYEKPPADETKQFAETGQTINLTTTVSKKHRRKDSPQQSHSSHTESLDYSLSRQNINLKPVPLDNEAISQSSDPALASDEE
jgi:hypothetical protein